MLSGRGLPSPRFTGSASSSGYPKGNKNAARTAVELLDLPERHANGTRPISLNTGTVGTLLPRSATSVCPTWSDAAMHFTVQQSIQELVQPQLDRLSMQLESILGSAQNEVRELERVIERWEVRAEGRFASFESRLAILSDGAARTEQRERDLNEKIAGIAEDILSRHAAVASESEGAALTVTPRLHDVEHRSREATSRLDRLEEALRKHAKSTRSADERLEVLEAAARRDDSEALQEQIEELWQHVNSIKHERHFAREYEERLEHMEEQVCALSVAAAQERSAQVAVVCSQLDQQRSDLEAHASKSDDRHRELKKQVDDLSRKQEVQAAVTAASPRPDQQALSARLDDINLKVGSLKVKTDSLDGRLTTVSERFEAARKPAEDPVQKQLSDRCEKFLEESEQRLEDVERRMDALSEDCEDVVEQALERRLAVLAGALPPHASTKVVGGRSSRDGRHRRKEPSHSPRLGTPSRPTACGDLKHEEGGTE
eukprot:gb/GFBE01074450.1/.p1 GENE.gb/GFBE01074450.1/~~gb/GFBE01074450.1/.p1  ORF type:complete len:488 (+),score=85.84 gb/GFBE01074450.1/:1-1464(+)